MHFYPGMSLREIESLSADVEEMLWQAITVIEAQQALVSLQIASYPHMKKSSQERVHREFNRLAYQWNRGEKRTITVEQMAALINGR